MADPSDRASQTCLLVYDGQCRLCVTAKKGLERLGTHADTTPIRMVPYQSEEAKQALGESYRPGRPNVAFRSVLTGRLPVGSMPFWPSCRAQGWAGPLSPLEPSTGEAFRLSAVLVCGPVPVFHLWQGSACGSFRESPYTESKDPALIIAFQLAIRSSS